MIREQNYILKKWLWPCGLCGARYNQNLTCWTTALEVCWSVCLQTFTTAVKIALAEFFSFFDVLQYFRLLLRPWNLCKTRFSIFLAGSNFWARPSQQKLPTVPLSFELYNNSQRWESVKFVKEKGEISQFSSLSRYSYNWSCPDTTFMLVRQTFEVLCCPGMSDKSL